MPAHEDLLVKQEVIDLTGWTARWVEMKEKSGELKTRDSGQRAPNGKPIKFYLASSLPSEAQMKRLKQRMSSHALVPIKQSPTAVATLPAPGSDSNSRSLASLNDEERKQAESRLQVIAPLIDFQNRTNGHRPVFRTDSGTEITSLSGVIEHVCAISGFSVRTVKYWWSRYKDGGAGALADRRRSDLNTSRYFGQHSEAAQFAQNKYLNERLSIKMVHEALQREWKRLRTGDQDKLPDYKTLRIYLQNLSPLVVAVAREGERRYKADFAPFLIRKIEAKRPNEYWISDHMIHDVWVRNDSVFGELDDNEAFRPVLTCIQDMRSRRVLGTAWCVNPSSESISSALRVALCRYGLPQFLYVDNGKDYKKVAGKSTKMPVLSEDCTSVLQRLDIKSQSCLPFHPQSKQIESFFHTFHQRFDVLFRAAGVYAGTSPATRPEECDANLREHKKLLKQREELRNSGATERDLVAAIDASPLPRASEFIRMAIEWIEEFNLTFSHTGQGMNYRSPGDIYDAELPPTMRAPVELAKVEHLFWDCKERVVSEGGCVELFNARYEPADQDSFAALMLVAQSEKKIRVFCDPLNVGVAIARSFDNQLLGYLRAQELLVHGETSAAQIRESMRARHRVYGAVKQLLSAQQRARSAAGDVTELEALSRRAIANVGMEPNIHRALPVLKAVNGTPEPRLHVDDIVDRFEEN